MGNLVTFLSNVRFDLSAFERNENGSWRVVTDTTIYSGAGSLEHTLLLPSGAQVEAHMFWADSIDLFDILESSYRGARIGSLPVADLTLGRSAGLRNPSAIDRL